MKRWLLVLAIGFAACGPSYGSTGVKTPEQLLDEQEALGAQQLAEEKKVESQRGPVGVTEDEKKREWDQHQAMLEMKRASLSAETCPNSVTEKSPKGRARISLVFQNDGHVKTSTLSSPYDKTQVGTCVLRAMNAVIVPAYVGDEHTLEWEVDLAGGHKSGPVGGSDQDSGSSAEADK